MQYTIKKIGHSCVTYERDGVKIMMDPGDWSGDPGREGGVKHVFISHKHSDHCSIPAIKAVLGRNPGAKVWTNEDGGAELTKYTIPWEKFEGGETRDFDGISIEAIGKTHARIHPDIPDISNTGLLMDGKLFHPGDSYLLPEKPVEVLALPLMSPWNTIAMAIEFAKAVKPKFCFNIHDGFLRSEAARFKGIPKEFLEKEGIEYFVLEDGESRVFEG